MRKKLANKINGGKNEYIQKRIDGEHFNGSVCYLKMKDVEKPLFVNDNICLLDNGYEWLKIYPDNEHYALTAMFDDNRNLIQWYFDIIKMSGLDNNIPFVDDLYLDLVITPDGKFIVLDEDELKDALDKKEITDEDFNLAYEYLEDTKNKFENNLDNLRKLTDSLYDFFHFYKTKNLNNYQFDL